jgi:transcriptional regulator with XRE-family HTH domain
MPISHRTSHPIDLAIRERVAALAIPQKDLAKAIGRSPGWVNKFLNGKGHATIDDLVRLLAYALGVQGLSDMERRMLKAWRRLPPTAQADAVQWFEDWVRREIRLVRKRR